MPDRARIADDELHFYENTIAESLEVLQRLEPAITRAIARGDSEEMHDLLRAGMAVNTLRQHIIDRMNRRKNGNGGGS